MIHYHGTPIGGKLEDAAWFLAGRHALVPFSHPEDIAIAALMPHIVAMQFMAKVAGGAVWAFIIGRVVRL